MDQQKRQKVQNNEFADGYGSESDMWESINQIFCSSKCIFRKKLATAL